MRGARRQRRRRGLRPRAARHELDACTTPARVAQVEPAVGVRRRRVSQGVCLTGSPMHCASAAREARCVVRIGAACAPSPAVRTARRGVARAAGAPPTGAALGRLVHRRTPRGRGAPCARDGRGGNAPRTHGQAARDVASAMEKLPPGTSASVRSSSVRFASPMLNMTPCCGTSVGHEPRGRGRRAAGRGGGSGGSGGLGGGPGEGEGGGGASGGAGRRRGRRWPRRGRWAAAAAAALPGAAAARAAAARAEAPRVAAARARRGFLGGASPARAARHEQVAARGGEFGELERELRDSRGHARVLGAVRGARRRRRRRPPVCRRREATLHWSVEISVGTTEPGVRGVPLHLDAPASAAARPATALKAPPRSRRQPRRWRCWRAQAERRRRRRRSARRARAAAAAALEARRRSTQSIEKALKKRGHILEH